MNQLRYTAAPLWKAGVVGILGALFGLYTSPWEDPTVVAYAAEGPVTEGAMVGLELFAYSFAMVGVQYGHLAALVLLGVSVFSLLVAGVVYGGGMVR